MTTYNTFSPLPSAYFPFPSLYYLWQKSFHFCISFYSFQSLKSFTFYCIRSIKYFKIINIFLNDSLESRKKSGALKI